MENDSWARTRLFTFRFSIFHSPFFRLSEGEEKILISLQRGSRLKVHRTLDGVKAYRLHGQAEEVSEAVGTGVVSSLQRRGLIESNLKFPAATFLLTDKGVLLASKLTGSSLQPTGPRNYAG